MKWNNVCQKSLVEMERQTELEALQQLYVEKEEVEEKREELYGELERLECGE